jgi:V/A-type H+/Na+-transporting ATPase subunit C
MIRTVFKYAYPQAKIRSMKGRLLSAEQYQELLRADSYQDFLRILRTTVYASSLKELSGESSIPELSRILYRNLFADYEKTIDALPHELQSFFILLYQKYELINLKTILRGICSNVPPDQIAPLLLPTKRHTMFSKEQLLTFRNVQDVVTYLQDTFFKAPLNISLHRYEREKDFFPLEMALDMHYYNALWDKTQELSRGDRKIARQQLGIVIDVLNISWIIRFKEQYHFAPEEILNYTIEHGYVLNFTDRRKLAHAHDASEIITYLRHTVYGKTLSGHESLGTVQILLTRQVAKQLLRAFSGYPFQIGIILGYLLLKEFEISDLITLAEAKKYEFSLEQSKNYIILAS